MFTLVFIGYEALYAHHKYFCAIKIYFEIPLSGMNLEISCKIEMGKIYRHVISIRKFKSQIRTKK